MRQAFRCECAEKVLGDGEADLVRFYHNAKLEFLKRAVKALRK